MRKGKGKTQKKHAYLYPHGVDVDFLVEIVEESDSLNDHSVDFVRREFELKPGQTGFQCIRQYRMQGYAYRANE